MSFVGQMFRVRMGMITSFNAHYTHCDFVHIYINTEVFIYGVQNTGGTKRYIYIYMHVYIFINGMNEKSYRRDASTLSYLFALYVYTHSGSDAVFRVCVCAVDTRP